MANKRDLSNGFLASPITAATTSIPLEAGTVIRMPQPPFKITVTPSNELSTSLNSEVMLVIGAVPDTLTVVRAQNGTTAKPFSAGAIVANGVYVEDVNGIEVTVPTARTTAVKVGTTPDGNYSPTLGDTLIVTFTLGTSVANPTLNIDGSGAKNIKIGDVNASTSTFSTGAVSTKIPLWYDGTAYQAYGSMLNTSTSYTEITEAEITTGTASTARTISGRRAQFIVDKARTGVVKSTTTSDLTASTAAPASPVEGDIWIDENEGDASVTTAALLQALFPVGSIYFGPSNGTMPSLIANLGTWTRVQGQFIVGVSDTDTDFDYNDVGGAKTHTLTTAQIPAHTHQVGQNSQNDPGGPATLGVGGGGVTGFWVGSNSNIYAGSMIARNTGGGEAHNNLPPFKAKYIWERTA